MRRLELAGKSVKGGVQAVIDALLLETGTLSLSAFIDAACAQPELALEPRALKQCFRGIYHGLSKEHHGFAPGEATVDASRTNLSPNEVRGPLHEAASV